MGPIILIGDGGYVGGAFARCLTNKNVRFYTLPPRKTLKDHFYSYLEDAINDIQPSAIINAAGYTGKPNVDACETDKGACVIGNVTLPFKLAELCKRKKITLGHVSSGCIYTGTKSPNGFTELDPPNFSFRQNNCSFYSGTKALGEEVLATYDNVYVWRLRIPFDNIDSPRNYLSKLMNYNCLLEAQNSISELGEFVDASVECLLRKVPTGIYNVTNTEFVETSEVVKLLKKYKLPNNKHIYKFFKNEDEFMERAAKTPRSNCVLDNSKLLACGIYMSNSYEAIEKCLKNWKTFTK